MPINRGTTIKSLTIENGAAVSEAFDMAIHAGATILMPAAWTAANIGFKVCASSDGTFLPLYDDSGSIVEVSAAASKAFSAPAALFGASWVKLWSQDGAGSDTNQGADRAITVLLKS
jgi:hypothetical protein